MRGDPIVVGSTERGEDGRVAIILDPAERTLVLREMRDFVAGVQRIADALSRDNMKDVASAARAVGTAKMQVASGNAEVADGRRR